MTMKDVPKLTPKKGDLKAWLRRRYKRLHGRRPATKIGLLVLDLTSLAVAIYILIVSGDFDYNQTFDLDTDHPWLINRGFLLLVTALGLIRRAFTPSREANKMYSQTSLAGFMPAAAIYFFAHTFWRPTPSALGSLSHFLDKSEPHFIQAERAFVRDLELQGPAAQRGKHFINVNGTLYRRIFPAEDHGKPRWPQTRRALIPWHPGALGIAWVERLGIEFLPSFYDEGYLVPPNINRSLEDFRAKGILMVATNDCMERQYAGFLTSVAEYAKGRHLVPMRLREANPPCERGDPTIEEKVIPFEAIFHNPMKTHFPGVPTLKTGGIYLFPPEAETVTLYPAPWDRDAVRPGTNLPARAWDAY